MKKPHVWVVEVLDGNNWIPCEEIARPIRKDSIQDKLLWDQSVPSWKHRVAKYVREKP